MRAITPVQSNLLSCEILAQANQLDVIARDFGEPWGRLSKERMLGLRNRRLHVVLPIPGMHHHGSGSAA